MFSGQKEQRKWEGTLRQLYIPNPGPAVCGGSRAAVPVIMEELGINFKKIISK
jgi:hypothetical protein